jgi:hypothetical protein
LLATWKARVESEGNYTAVTLARSHQHKAEARFVVIRGVGATMVAEVRETTEPARVAMTTKSIA